MTYPNLVIAGAPKCGTSSLFNWLVEHPEVCGSTPKETFFLMDKDNPLRRRDCNFHNHGLDAYTRFFEGCGQQYKVVVEATTHYIYQETALEVLASLPTRPRILFLLRKPSERVLSSFAYSKNNLGRVRGDLSFADFVRLVRGRPACGLLEQATEPSAYVLARDLRYSRYIEYLSRWREHVGDDRICVLLFEDMRADSKAMMQTLSGWLRIDPHFYDDFEFEARNRTVALRSPRIQRVARAVAARAPASAVKNLLKQLYSAVQWKTPDDRRTAADEAALVELDEEFRPYNERLAREFGLNLHAWD